MFLRTLAVVGFCLPLAAAEPRKLDLWEAGKSGYEVYRIPGLVVTPKGTLLAYCEARKGARSDWGTIDIQMRRSTDGGATWSEPRKIAEVPGPHTKNPVATAQKLGKADDVTYNNPVMIPDRKTGAIHFLFCLEYMRCFYQRSDDDGLTFTQPVEITAAFEKFRPGYDWKVIATGPGHGIRLVNGRLLVPIWMSTGTGGHAHRPSVLSTIVSDDAGKTWQRGEIVANETDPLVNPNETCAEQLADGRVMLNIRSESKENRRAVAFSKDGSTGWTKPAFDNALLEPVCFASLCRWSAKPDAASNLILFANPDNLERADGKAKPGGNRDRKNLTVKLSEDDGATWKVAKPLETGASGYSDLAVGPKGEIYCLYERNGSKALTLAEFDFAWLRTPK